VHRCGEYRGHTADILQLLVLGDRLLSLGSDGKLLVWRIGEYAAPEVAIQLPRCVSLRGQGGGLRCSCCQLAFPACVALGCPPVFPASSHRGGTPTITLSRSLSHPPSSRLPPFPRPLAAAASPPPASPTQTPTSTKSWWAAQRGACSCGISPLPAGCLSSRAGALRCAAWRPLQLWTSSASAWRTGELNLLVLHVRCWVCGWLGLDVVVWVVYSASLPCVSPCLPACMHACMHALAYACMHCMTDMHVSALSACAPVNPSAAEIPLCAEFQMGHTSMPGVSLTTARCHRVLSDSSSCTTLHPLAHPLNPHSQHTCLHPSLSQAPRPVFSLAFLPAPCLYPPAPPCSSLQARRTAQPAVQRGPHDLPQRLWGRHQCRALPHRLRGAGSPPGGRRRLHKHLLPHR
jgi:hypothetical protein